MKLEPKDVRKIPTYCYQCVAGPDLLTVKVEQGVATEVEPNFCAANIHPGGGKVCVKAYGLVQNLQPAPGADTDETQQPQKRARPGPGLCAHQLGRSVRADRLQAQRDSRRRYSRCQWLPTRGRQFWWCRYTTVLHGH